jgi:nitroreductase
MAAASSDIWKVMSTARTIRRFTDDPVDEATLTRCLEAATWAPSGANAQAWRFVVLRSPEHRAVVAKAAANALEVIEPVYGMTRPAEDDHAARARNNRATYELHDRAANSRPYCLHRSAFRRRPSCCSAGRSFRRCRTFCWPPPRRASGRA